MQWIERYLCNILAMDGTSPPHQNPPPPSSVPNLILMRKWDENHNAEQKAATRQMVVGYNCLISMLMTFFLGQFFIIYSYLGASKKKNNFTAHFSSIQRMHTLQSRTFALNVVVFFFSSSSVALLCLRWGHTHFVCRWIPLWHRIVAKLNTIHLNNVFDEYGSMHSAWLTNYLQT